MKKFKLFTFLVMLLFVGCATYAEMRQMDKFEDTSKAYKRAIVWSDFDAASTYIDDKDIKSEDGKNEVLDLDKLKAFKVASYDLRKAIPSSDKTKVVQIVEITYFRLHTLVLKSLSDRQVWEWSEEDGRWYLKSGLPQFK